MDPELMKAVLAGGLSSDDDKKLVEDKSKSSITINEESEMYKTSQSLAGNQFESTQNLRGMLAGND